MKEAGKHFSRLGFLFLLGTLLITCLQEGIVFLVGRFRPEWLENSNIMLMTALLPMYLIGIPVLVLLVKRIPAITIPRRPMRVGHYLLAIIMSFCLTYCSNIVGLLTTFIIGLLKGSQVNNVIADITSGVSLVWIFIYMVICAPIIEELVFRKLIVDRTARFGQGVAVVVSGLMFGLFHGNLNQFAYAFALGAFFAFIYVKTGNIKYTIGLHMIINFVGGVVSTRIMEMMDYESYLAAYEAGAGTEELMQIIMAAIPGWLAYFVLLFFMGGTIIAGIVLFAVFFRRFTFETGEVQIPGGQRFKTIIGNPGMLLFVGYWVAAIIWQLFG